MTLRFTLLILCFYLQSSLSAEDSPLQQNMLRSTIGGKWTPASKPHNKLSIIPILNKNISLVQDKKIPSESLKLLCKSYLLQKAKACFERKLISKELILWLRETPELNKNFWTALDPQHDNIKQAIHIFDELRKQYPNKVKQYFHLAIAISIVWDSPQAVESSRQYQLFGYQKKQFQKPLSFKKVFAYFSNSKNKKKFNFNITKMQWPYAIHLVDLDLNIDDILWALDQYSKNKNKHRFHYHDIPDDNQKLSTHTSILSEQPFLLKNLKKFGGLSSDKAYYASRVARVFGSPSVKLYHQGIFGGIPYSWSGHLSQQKNQKSWLWVGKEKSENLYTGLFFNPQKQCLESSQDLLIINMAIEKNFEKYLNAQILSQMANQLREQDKPLSILILKEALRQNSICKDAWSLLIHHLAQGNIDKKKTVLLKLLNKMKPYTDIIFQYSKTLSEKSKDLLIKDYLNQNIHSIFRKRADLFLLLTKIHCDDLIKQGKPLEAMILAGESIVKHSSEGIRIIPLAKVCAKLGIQLKKTSKAKSYLMRVNIPKRLDGESSIPKAQITGLIESLKMNQ